VNVTTWLRRTYSKESAMARQRHEANPKASEITFGIEIECFLPRGSVRVGSYHSGIELGGSFPAGWNAQSDGSLTTSLHNYQGVEVVSPVLRGRDGLEQVRKVAALLEEMNARVNKTCGFHIHLGAMSAAGESFDEIADWVRRLLNTTAQHEKAFYGASGTKAREMGTYCRSLKTAWSGKKERLTKPMKAEDLRDEVAGLNRYHALNLVPLFGHNRTVEFRCFSGTTSGAKMTAWIQMALAVATLALERNTRFDAPQTGYADTTTAVGAMKRFFYLAGWTRGRKDYYKPVCVAEGWVDEMTTLDAAKRELMRLAKKYDGQAA
jgi:hypothetical protein